MDYFDSNLEFDVVVVGAGAAGIGITTLLMDLGVKTSRLLKKRR